MIFHDVYARVPEAELHRFVSSQQLARLLTVGGDGTPHVGLYPFVWDGAATFELHLVRADEQVADLVERPRTVVEVDEVLGVIPSYWVHPELGAAATAYHRTAIFEGRAEVAIDPARVAAQQTRLLAHHQPEGGHRPVDPADQLYRGYLAQLAAVTVTVERTRVKFKLGQNRPPEVRRRVADELRRRGGPGDARAAEALEWTLARDGA